MTELCSAFHVMDITWGTARGKLVQWQEAVVGYCMPKSCFLIGWLCLQVILSHSVSFWWNAPFLWCGVQGCKCACTWTLPCACTHSPFLLLTHGKLFFSFIFNVHVLVIPTIKIIWERSWCMSYRCNKETQHVSVFMRPLFSTGTHSCRYSQVHTTILDKIHTSNLFLQFKVLYSPD